MDDVKKLELKIEALRQAHTRRIEELDNLVAELRVALTEKDQTLNETVGQLSITQQELYALKEANETQAQEEVSDED